jgi:hypothetical protein
MLIFLLLLFTQEASATEFGKFFAVDVCGDKQCEEMLTKIESAAGKQFGYESKLSETQIKLSEYSNKQLNKYAKDTFVEAPAAVLIYSAKVYREKQVKIPIVKKKAYIIVKPESTTLHFTSLYKSLHSISLTVDNKEKKTYVIGIGFNL